MFISAAAAVPSVVALLTSTSACLVIHDAATQTLVAAAVAEAGLRIPTKEAVTDLGHSPRRYTSELTAADDADAFLLILHTSGSIGVPKIVPITHRSFLNQTGYSPDAGVLLATSMSHGYGQLMLAYCLGRGRPFFHFPASLPLTSKSVIRAVDACNPVLLASVPTVTGMLKDQGQWEVLRKAFAIANCGSQLPQALGDEVVRNGVRVWDIYGSSELSGAGLISANIWDHSRPNTDWNCHTPHPDNVDDLVFEPYDEGVFQLIALPSFPSLSKSNRPDGSYATGDLFMRDSTGEGWTYASRSDDMINLSTGFKTNPLPIEAMLNVHPAITQVMAVGFNRPQIGVLVSPNQDGEEAAIHAAVREVNTRIPKFSRITADMVKILPSTATFALTPRGSLKRHAVLKEYSEVIDQLYSGPGSGSLTLSSEEEAYSVVMETLRSLHEPAPAEHDDFFLFGIDSVGATRVRNLLWRTLDLPELSANVLFENPSPRKLAGHLWALSQGVDASTKSRSAEMLKMLEEAKQSIHVKPNQASSSNDGKILLTGGNGVLGRHILVQISARPDVKVIYLPIRALSDAQAEERVEESLRDGQLPSLTDLRKQAQIHPYPLGTKIPSADIVIHTAWPVNFNLSLSTFTSSISGCCELLNTLPSARHVFTSSISTMFGHTASTMPESFLNDPSTASIGGYGQSKWVAEGLYTHARTLGYSATIIRIGQISGDTIHGIWNEKEAPPLMFRSAQAVGCLPNRDYLGADIRWLGVDICAAAVVGLATTTTAGGVYNLTSTSATPFRSILAWLAKEENLGDSFKVVTYAKWVEALKGLEEDTKKHPTLKLINYFAHGVLNEGLEEKVLDMDRTLSVLGGKVDLSGIDERVLGLCVAAWRRRGFLATTSKSSFKPVSSRM